MQKQSQLYTGPLELNRVGNASPTLPKSLGDWRALVGRAFGRAGIAQKEAASRLDVTQSALSKQLSGFEHLSFWRMLNLGPDFWAEMVTLIIEFHELPAPGATPRDLEDMRIGRAYRELQELASKVRA